MANQKTSGVRNYAKSLIDKILVQGLWTGCVAIAGAIATYFVSRKFNFSNLEIILFIIIVVMLVVTISYIIYRRTNRRLPVFDVMDCNFHMIREERIHRWLDEENYTHKRRYTLRAMKN